jgi:hypothetical protein
MRGLAAQQAIQGHHRRLCHHTISSSSGGSSSSHTSNSSSNSRLALGTTLERMAQCLESTLKARRWDAPTLYCMIIQSTDGLTAVSANDPVLRPIHPPTQRRASSSTTKAVWLRSCGSATQRTECAKHAIRAGHPELATAPAVEHRLLSTGAAGRLPCIQQCCTPTPTALRHTCCLILFLVAGRSA